MGWTTGQTASQLVTVLQSHGATSHAAQQAVYNLAWTKSVSQVLYGVLCQCTSGWNDGSPVFEYDATPSAGSANQTITQAVTALVSAGMRQDQAVHVVNGLAWYPGASKTCYGVLVTCTTGWNSGAPAFSVNSTPS